MITQLTKSLLVLLVLVPIVRPQSPHPSARADEEKKIQEERHKKALALIDVIVEEMRALKLPENRIRVDMTLTELLWSQDEKRARSLFKEAAASLGELISAINIQDPDSINDAQIAAQLRQEMLLIVMRHDPKLALEFLRTTRSALYGQQTSSVQVAQEAQLEMNVAAELATRDPGEALIMGEASLKNGIDYSATNLLSRLQSADKVAAQKFLGAMLNRLRTEDFSLNGGALYVVLELLGRWIESNRNRSIAATQPQEANLQPPMLDDQSVRELSGILIKVLLDTGSRNFGPHRFSPQRITDVVRQLTALMPDAVSAGQAPALRRRMAELEMINEAQSGPWAKYQAIVQSGTAEDLMEASKTAPPEIRANLVQNAVWKAFNEGHEERARQIAENIADPRQRAEMVLNLDRQSFNRAGERQNLATARTLLSRIPSVEERARMLAQLAVNAASRGDKPAAFELAREGETLVGDRALNYQQLGAQLQIAHAYGQLDPRKQAAMVETAIDRLNELAAAASVLNGFDISGYFRGGEFVIRSGNPLSSSIQQLAAELGPIVLDDFERARSLAERFQRGEMRVMVLLQIAGEGLSSDN